LCYAAAGLFFVISGCAPSSSNRPELTQSAASAAGPQSTQPRSGEGQSGSTKESNLAGSSGSASSLDQLRDGKSSATSASSPLKDVYFDYDKYDLRGDARDVLRANADWIKNNPAARIEIEGHCDDRGTNEYNLALGAKRAQSVKEYLTTLGITSERLSTISYGAEIPVCKDQNENCWRQNRRARFVVVSGAKSAS
jgi:peptidoglycan-associated lipoprotein